MVSQAAPIALFGDDAFFYPNANFAFTHRTVSRLLADVGLEAVTLSAVALADPEVFNATRTPILLMIYGDAYPAKARDNLMRFHRDGGCLVANGVPFGFPCRRGQDRWDGAYPPEEESDRAHGRIGTGRWAQVPDDGRIGYDAEADVLGLGFLPWDTFRVGEFYGLDAGSLDPHDRVRGIVSVSAATDEFAWAVAVIEHRCDDYPGAIDVWAGSSVLSEPRLPKIAAQEVVWIHALAYLLERRGLVSADEADAVRHRMRRRYDSFAKEPIPAPDPRPFAPAARNDWGKSVVPHAATPEPAFDVLSLEGLSVEEQRLALSLQGLANRERPRVWLHYNPRDPEWLEWLIARGRIEATRALDFDGFVARYRSLARGAVVPPDLFMGQHLATMVAAASDLAIASPQLAERFGLPIVEDLRGRWSTGAQGLAWALETLHPALDANVSAYISPENVGMIDYLVANRVFTFWITGPRDALFPGGDTVGEIAFADRLLARQSFNTPVLGFGHHSRYEGLGEAEGVERVSRFGKFQIVIGRASNLSVISALREDRLVQRRRTPPTLDRGKAYLALVLSDGDNLNYWPERFRTLWDQPGRGTGPMGWSIGPSAVDLEPGVLPYYYETMTDQDQFVAAVSGVGYTYPELYGLAYADPGRVLDGFLNLTRDKMQQLDLRGVHVHHHGLYRRTSREMYARYARVLRRDGGPLEIILTDYGHRPDAVPDYAASVYAVADGVPVLHAATPGNPADVVEQVRTFLPPERPAFLFVFVTPWRLKLAEFWQAAGALGPDAEWVTPEELGRLYHEAGQP